MNGHFCYDWRCPDGSFVHKITIVNCGSRRVDASSIASVLDWKAQKDVLPDAFVIRIFEKDFDLLEKEFTKSPLSFGVRNRLKNRCGVFVISHRGDGTLCRVAPNNSEGQAMLDLFTKHHANMLEVGLDSLFNSNRVLQEAPSGFVFVKPSGDKSTHFLRAEHALASSENVEFLATSLLSRLGPWLSKKKSAPLITIYVDSMAIASLAYVMRELYVKHSEELHAPNVESFHSYVGLKEIPRPIPQSSLCLISASSSMNLARDWIKEMSVKDDEVVVLLTFADAKTASKAVFRLAKPMSWRSGSELEKDLSLRDLRILGESFDAEEIPIKQVILSIRHQCKDSAVLVRDSGAENGLRVYGGRSVNGKQPRPLFIDQKILLNSAQLTAWTTKQVEQRIPASTECIIYQDDEFSKKFAQKIQRSLLAVGRKTQLISQGSISKSTVKVPRTSCLVIVGLVIGRGTKLLSISRELRNLHVGARYYLIGIQASESLDQQKRLGENLGWSSSNADVKILRFRSIALGTTAEASFSREATLTSTRAMLKKPSSAPEGQRARQLIAGDIGLRENIFLPSTYQKNRWLPLRQDFALWKDFPIYNPGAKHAACVLAHISGVLQRARESRLLPNELSLNSPSIQQVVIDPETFVRFDDGILRAALLRCAHDSELDYSAHSGLSEQMLTILKNILAHPNSVTGEASLEFALALRIKRLRLTNQHLTELMSKVTSELHTKKFPFKDYLIALLSTGSLEEERPLL